MKKIYIVEDNIAIRTELSKFLTKHHYECVCSEDFTTIVDKIKSVHPDLILLDIELPNVNGYDICKQIREKNNIPIIFVTARQSEQDELKSMQLGGDDFITKPYNLSILLARIRSVLKRSDPDYSSEIFYEDFCLDLKTQQLRHQDQEIDLTRNEFKIVYHFFTHQNEILVKDSIIENLWVNKCYVDENILNVNITRIRKKLKDNNVPMLIQSVPGKGYQL